jgi:hypothetical protein
MMLLDSEQSEFVEEFFIKQRNGHLYTITPDTQLNLEVYDEETFIDRVVESQIQF